MTRERLARVLVRACSWPMDRSYQAYCYRDTLGGSDRPERVLARIARAANRLLLPVARRLDRAATGDQMALEGWWG